MQPSVRVGLCLLLVNATSVFGLGLDKSFEARIREIEGRTVYLRPTFNSSRKIYCEPAGKYAFALYGQGNFFPLKRKVQVVIKDTRYLFAENRLRIKFEHEHLGPGQIFFQWLNETPPTVESFDQLFRYVFSPEEGDDGFTPFVLNRESGMVHYIGCNHLPVESSRVYYSRIEQLADEKHRECELCFNQFPPVRDYFLERKLGGQAYAALRNQFDVSQNQYLNRRLTEVGQKVLAHWPTGLRGYDYSFRALNSGIPNAVACPGGRVFVSTGLYFSLETEKELEGVLAHEIAHIERRHGLQQYKKASRDRTLLQLLEPFAGYAISKAARDVYQEVLSLKSAELLVNLATRLIVQGYGLHDEREADFYAIAYLLDAYGDYRSYGEALRKLQYAENIQGATGIRQWVYSDNPDAHPDIDFRIECAEGAKMEIFGPTPVFTGYDENGEEVARLTLESQVLSKGIVYGEPPRTNLTDYGTLGKWSRDKTVERLYLFASLSSTLVLGESCNIREIQLITDNGRVKLDDYHDTGIFPDDEVGIAFEADTGRMLKGIRGVELKLGKVQRWVAEP
ncbi:MAG: M48 family metalloprotease [Candidatus Glassbacteria bacterium]